MSDLVEPIQEHWRAAIGWPGYEVSDIGNVKRSQLLDPSGRVVYQEEPVAQVLGGSAKWHLVRYWEVSLRIRKSVRKSVKVHHLVVDTWIGPPPKPGLVRCHGPGGELDNRVINLRWDTQSANIEDMHRERGGHHNSLKKTCLNGHDITNPDNVYANAAGRKCKKCQQARSYARANEIADYRTLL